MRSRGFILVLTLMLCTLLMVLGMGLLGSRSAQYRGAAGDLLAAEARALAEAGLEDARVKLDKDLFFPPPTSAEQLEFSYQEAVSAQDDGTVVGFYRVVLDLSRLESPAAPDVGHPSLYLVTSTGSLGPDPTKPLARVTLRMEVDVDEGTRPFNPPTRPFRVTDWVEGLLN
jgi:hypothetical protein